MKKWVVNIFAALVFLSLLTPFWVFKDLLFPYITSKAFFFRIAIEAALPFYLYLIIAEKKLRPNLKNLLNVTVLAFLGINIIASFAGVNLDRSLWGGFERMGGTYYLAHLVALYFYVQILGQTGGSYLKRFLQAFILAAVAVTLNGLSGWVGGPMLVQDPSLPARVSSTFGNPIFFPSYLIIPMFLSAYFALQEQKKFLKVLYWIAATLQLAGIYSSNTRGAIVGLIAGLFISAVIYVILAKNPKVRRYGGSIILFFVIMVGGLYVNHNKFAPGSVVYRLTNLRDSNTEARLIQWGMAIRGAKDHLLLGVGPENYYVIFDAYYNPEMYRYDASWFDKPHNFLIEVLTTTGVPGLLLYLAMFGLAIYALWKAYQAELIGLLEMCVLLAAMIAYQVQNLTVFDTVSASVAFYGFLGLATYLWTESASVAESKPAQATEPVLFAQTVLVIALLVMAYVEFASNISSLQASKRTNFGLAYTGHDSRIAAAYFESALAVPFNLDPRETANRYSDFVAQLLSNNAKEPNLDFATQQIDKATANQREIAEKIQNDPLLWMRLAIDEMNQAIAHNQDVNAAQDSINKAIALAPNRLELLQLQMQLDGYKKDWKGAALTAGRIVALNPRDPSLRWQLAMAYYLNGQTEEAVKEGDMAVQQGFKFTQLQQFFWYIQYYEKKEDYNKVAPLLEQAIALQPNELGLYVDLAHAYAALGDFGHAQALAEQVAKSDPTQQAAMDEFIKTLH